MRAWRTLVAASFAAALLAGWTYGRMPAAVLAACAAFSTLAFLLYRRDKLAAQASRARTPERTLHLVALLGGWPGALVAQQHYRHKTRKARFQLLFWATVLLNCLAAAWVAGLVHPCELLALTACSGG